MEPTTVGYLRVVRRSSRGRCGPRGRMVGRSALAGGWGPPAEGGVLVPPLAEWLTARPWQVVEVRRRKRAPAIHQFLLKMVPVPGPLDRHRPRVDPGMSHEDLQEGRHRQSSYVRACGCPWMRGRMETSAPVRGSRGPTIRPGGAQARAAAPTSRAAAAQMASSARLMSASCRVRSPRRRVTDQATLFLPSGTPGPS